MKTGKKIAKARKDINMTQDQLAELLQVTRQTISKWESDLAFPETSKIPKLSDALKVSCDYLLKDNEIVTAEVSLQGSNKYTIDWTKLYPVLGEYQNTVDCKEYSKVFVNLIEDMMKKYNYSLENSMLVLKDLFYKTYLQMNNKQK
ncbi:helix-turn-helix domain-containing protein [Clostridium sp. Marseille-Q2269]|uniref:helix-turn-helix domain-containing protein n=1 Tax=Clostridium sp. Marseille-Q2269 TaxID=2942205 RepID=UPI002072CFF9|nr:helix-turn-helix domain-containing protein [Clostridium sp. Marseille-Q2269]